MQGFSTMRKRLSCVAFLLGLAAGPVFADTADASCEIYPAGSDKLDRMVDCTFSQRQGNVLIRLEDGTEYDLQPVGDTPGNFRDSNGDAVYRQSGLGELGQIFRFPKISIFVYWERRDQDAGDAQNATAPFSTDEYDATALLRCGEGVSDARAICPAGVARMEDGQASVTVQSPDGQQFTLNFMKDTATREPYVNASGREVAARMEADSWIVVVDGTQVYEVPEVFLIGD